MRVQRIQRHAETTQVTYYMLIIIAGLAFGASLIVYQSPLSLLVTAMLLAGVTALVVCAGKPVWAFYGAIFVVLLPSGLLEPLWHSTLNRAMLMIALITWIANVLSAKRSIEWSYTCLIMLAFLVWSSLTLVYADNLTRGTIVLQVYVARLVLYLILAYNLIRTFKNMDYLLRTLAFYGWVLMLISFVSIILQGYESGTRLRVLTENENSLGIMALVSMAGILWMAMHPQKRNRVLWRCLAFIYMVMTIAIIAMSGSRGSAISLLITLLALFFWRDTRMWGKVCLTVIIFLGLTAPFIFSTTISRFAIESNDTLLGGREAIWQAALQLVREHPFRGVGIGNASNTIIPLLQAWDYQDEIGVAIHNPILAICCETGALGIAIYLGVLISAIASFVRQYFLCKRHDVQYLMPYFVIVASIFLGYMASWLKGGGMESDSTYFLMLSLLLVPSSLNRELCYSEKADPEDTD